LQATPIEGFRDRGRDAGVQIRGWRNWRIPGLELSAGRKLCPGSKRNEGENEKTNWFEYYRKQKQYTTDR
jgi:hypothetical protein